jgi:formiminotetrahydrofolate cyclodeaminase
MKIHPKSDELSREEKLYRGIKNALKLPPPEENSTEEEKAKRLVILNNFLKFYENLPKKPKE